MQAPPKFRIRPAQVTPVEVPDCTPMPKHVRANAPSAKLNFWGPASGSCRKKSPNKAVKKTCVCISTEANEAVMPTLSAMNSRPN